MLAINSAEEGRGERRLERCLSLMLTLYRDGRRTQLIVCRCFSTRFVNQWGRKRLPRSPGKWLKPKRLGRDTGPIALTDAVRSRLVFTLRVLDGKAALRGAVKLLLSS
jgi:hypothetical protein